MDRRPAPKGVDRRTFLLGSVGSAIALGLAGCVPDPPPTPTPAPPTPTPTPSPEGIRPTAFHRSNWTADPFARGAFSFDAVGGGADDRIALTVPVDDRLFFAGEACSVDAPGTLQGAYADGLRVADAVAEVTLSGERIVIVGAGLTGLVAARALADRGFETLVFEARDRVGGRIETVEDDGRYAELGASFIASDAEELLGALDEADVATRPFAFLPFAYPADGEPIEVPPEGELAVAAASEWARQQSFDSSLQTALVRSGVLDTVPEAEGVPGPAWVDVTLRSAVAPLTGADADRVSASRFSFPPGGFGRTADQVTGSLAELALHIADGLEVTTATPVAQIAHDGERVSLRFETGESLLADRVVITVPVGVLKTDAIAFSPPLPRRLQAAIAVLGAGLLDVVRLRFETPFWRRTFGPTVDGFHPTVLAPLDPPSDALVAAWLDPEARAFGEPVLVAQIAGRAAARAAELDDDELLKAILAELDRYVAPSEATGTPEPSAD